MFDLNTRILVVDNMLTMRKLLVKSLNELGFRDVTEAEDGIKAWEIIQNSKNQIGLVLSDWTMPKSTGMDLLKRLRSDSRAGAIPFIFVTTENNSEKIAEALRHGISAYIMKPFTTAILSDKLEQAAKKQKTA